MLGGFQETLQTCLQVERHLPKAQRRSARRLFEGLQAEGYRDAYDSVQRFVRRWKSVKSGPALTQAYVAQSPHRSKNGQLAERRTNTSQNSVAMSSSWATG
jgi:hypothetical protein